MPRPGQLSCGSVCGGWEGIGRGYLRIVSDQAWSDKCPAPFLMASLRRAAMMPHVPAHHRLGLSSLVISTSAGRGLRMPAIRARKWGPLFLARAEVLDLSERGAMMRRVGRERAPFEKTSAMRRPPTPAALAEGGGRQARHLDAGRESAGSSARAVLRRASHPRDHADETPRFVGTHRAARIGRSPAFDEPDEIVTGNSGPR